MVSKRLTSTRDFNVGDMVSMLFEDEGDHLRRRGRVVSKRGKYMKVKCGDTTWEVQPSHSWLHIRKIKKNPGRK